jgi:general secretion pathway protein D
MRRGLRIAGLIAAAGAMVAMGACATKKQAALDPAAPPRPLLPPSQYEPGPRTITHMLAGPTIAPGAGPMVVHRQKLSPVAQTEAVEPAIIDGNPGVLQPVKITVKQAGIEDVVRILLGPDGLDRSYVIDPAVVAAQAGKSITMDIDEEMTRADMDDLLQGIALLQGWTIEQRAGVTYIRPMASAAQNPNAPIIDAQTLMGTEQPVVRLKRLRYLTAADASAAVTPLLSTGGKLVPSGRTVLIVDTASQANRLSRVLAALDVPAFANVEVWTYKLASRSPEAAASLLTSIVQPLGISSSTAAGTEGSVAFVPVPESSRLLVIARDATVQTFVHDLIRQIDMPEDRIARGRYIYRIQHFEPAELRTVMESFFADRLDTASTAGSGAAQSQSRTANGIRFVVDVKEKIMLITATPDDYAQVIGTLAVLDQPRQQVAMTSIIAEVALTNNLEYGVEYFLRALDMDGLGILELAGGASDLVSGGLPTGSAVFTAADGFAVIQALQRESNVNILSQPNLTARDGAKAIIQVGGETPVPEGDVDTETGGLRRDITYRSIGITLTITPTINESGDVTMEIKQDIADVLAQSELGPEFTTRQLETTVTVPHGMTLLLGGIIQTETTDNERKIPILGDLPVAGEAFKSRNLIKERRELLLAITPRVISTPAMAQRTVSDFLVAAQGVADSLRDNIDVLDRGVLYTPAVMNAAPGAVIGAPAPAPAPEPIPAPAESATGAEGTPVGALEGGLNIFLVPATELPHWTVALAAPPA